VAPVAGPIPDPATGATTSISLDRLADPRPGHRRHHLDQPRPPGRSRPDPGRPLKLVNLWVNLDELKTAAIHCQPWLCAISPAPAEKPLANYYLFSPENRTSLTGPLHRPSPG